MQSRPLALLLLFKLSELVTLADLSADYSPNQRGLIGLRQSFGAQQVANRRQAIWSQPDPRVAFSAPFEFVKVATRRANESLARAIAGARLAKPSSPVLAYRNEQYEQQGQNNQEHQVQGQRARDQLRLLGRQPEPPAFDYAPVMSALSAQSRQEDEQQASENQLEQSQQYQIDMQGFDEPDRRRPATASAPSQPVAPLYQLALPAESPAAMALSKQLGPTFALMPVGYAGRLAPDWQSNSANAAPSPLSSYASKLMALLRPSALLGAIGRDQLSAYTNQSPSNASLLPAQLYLLAPSQTLATGSQLQLTSLDDELVHQATSRTKSALSWPNHEQAPVCLQPLGPARAKRPQLAAAAATEWPLVLHQQQQQQTSSPNEANRESSTKTNTKTKTQATRQRQLGKQAPRKAKQAAAIRASKAAHELPFEQQQQLEEEPQTSSASEGRPAELDASPARRKPADADADTSNSQQARRTLTTTTGRAAMIPFTINDKIEFRSSSQAAPAGRLVAAAAAAAAAATTTTTGAPLAPVQGANQPVQFDEPAEPALASSFGKQSVEQRAVRPAPNSIADLKMRQAKTSFVSAPKQLGNSATQRRPAVEYSDEAGGGLRVRPTAAAAAARQRDTVGYSFPLLMASSSGAASLAAPGDNQQRQAPASSSTLMPSPALAPAANASDTVELVVEQDRPAGEPRAAGNTTGANHQSRAPEHSAFADESLLSGSAESEFERISESLQTSPLDLIDLQNSRSAFALPAQLESISMLSERNQHQHQHP